MCARKASGFPQPCRLGDTNSCLTVASGGASVPAGFERYQWRNRRCSWQVSIVTGGGFAALWVAGLDRCQHPEDLCGMFLRSKEQAVSETHALLYARLTVGRAADGPPLAESSRLRPGRRPRLTVFREFQNIIVLKACEISKHF